MMDDGEVEAEEEKIAGGAASQEDVLERVGDGGAGRLWGFVGRARGLLSGRRRAGGRQDEERSRGAYVPLQRFEEV